ncbi:extracellular solute-binding protein [Amphritea atlantica]|uniref:Extracellular solute-binding protein n=1 Tax=Amphritea atlantica TaxID=355243 RepID=A0ABY5GVT4_9GAMM|nr:extracellular solute-binding protein [Amphritea atlantica]
MKITKISLVAGLALSFSGFVAAESQTLNVYNWWDYIKPEVIKNFEADTGIKVNYDVYDSNEVLEAKLMAGNSGYDLVVPSGSFLERQAKAGIYQELDRSKLSNYSNLDPTLLKKAEINDPGNRVGVPYAWGTIGLGYNEDMLRQRLGDRPFNTLDLSKATDLFKKVRGNIKYFNSGNLVQDLVNGDVCVTIGYNGDLLRAQKRADEAGVKSTLKYAIPKEGTIAWFDLVAIPADSTNSDAAHQFINYLLKPENAADISNFVMYAVPNTKVGPFLDEAIRTNQGIYPDEELKANLFSQKAHTAKFDRRLTSAWSSIKTGR